MIDGIEVAVDPEAVVVMAREPLTVLSSAFVRGGFTAARAIVNLHVPKDLREEQTDGLLPSFAVRRGIPGPWVGLLTSAWTEKAEVATATGCGAGIAKSCGAAKLTVVTPCGVTYLVTSGISGV